METIFDKEKKYWTKKNSIPNLLKQKIDQYKNKGLNLLDLGCGGGRIINHYSQFFKSCCGIDNSFFLIQEAKNQNKECDFVFGDFQKKSSWKNFNKFDLIVSNCSIRKDYCPDLKSIFDLCFDYLANNGVLIFRIQSFEDMENILKKEVRFEKFYKKDDILSEKFDFSIEKEVYFQKFSSIKYVNLFLKRINIENEFANTTNIKREYMLITGLKK